MIDPRNIIDAPQSLTLGSCAEGFLPWLLADLTRSAASQGRVVYIARDDAAASAVLDTAAFFAPDIEVVSLPAWDCLPYDRSSPAARPASERLAALAQIGSPAKKAQLLVTTVNAALQRILPATRLQSLVRYIRAGSQMDRDALTTLFLASGYSRADTVVEPGEFAVRGGIVDVYPAGSALPVRLDFFGDEIDAIRRFEPADQRTVEKIKSFALLPVSEVLLDEANIRRFRQGYVEHFGSVIGHDPLYAAVSEGRRLTGMEHWLPLFEEKLVTLFDYLGRQDLVILDSHGDAAASSRLADIQDYYDARKSALLADKGSYHPLSPDKLYLTPSEWQDALTKARAHRTSPFSVPPSAQAENLDVQTAHDFAAERQNQPGNLYNAVKEHLDQLRQKGARKVILASYSAGARERLMGLLVDHGVATLLEAQTWQEALGAATKGIALVVLPLEHGFTAPDVALLTEQDILGDRLIRKRRKARRADAFLTELSALNPGDLVVHMDHGIGRYLGLSTIPVSGAPHDCVSIEYSDNAKLYVPVENIEVLTRYGSDSEGITLDKLGGANWQARKAKLKERILEIAGELLKIAAARVLQEAPVIEPDTQAYAEFCDRFPYMETEDQNRAVADVLEDLAAGKPMDRLVCGDVGFGKTEVALRAAFVAALAGYQVAIVCPTTLLARQHAQTFEARFRGLPLKIGRLSRLVGSKEAAQVKEGLANGTLDIVVGTHALLSKGLTFKRLGLVIVDEEQHFGVVHKERLKQLRANIHVLTLTATPIPRTLQMAMTGLRDLSLIATPPVDRLAVRTYIAPWDNVVIREALLREHYRGGQSFVVVPRIADLSQVETYLRESVPEIRPIMAHGQMAPSEIEERMTAFCDRKNDVLLSTTIVESGLDIPSANTLIIYRADMFGLAQLYQLRGRVGRSKVRAYAYLTTEPKSALTATAEKRLHVLSSLDGLGAGFQLASHDLDIRGAGNLLGDEQSGHIREIGFELYQQMLEEAILAARSDSAGLEALRQEEYSPQITLGVSILIPEVYVPDLALRMGLYRRIGDLTTRAEIDAFAAELIDRFGKLPEELRNLLQVVEIKSYCRHAGISKLEAGPRGLIVTFREDRFANPAGLVAYLTRLKSTAKLRPDHKLVVARDWSKPADRLVDALALAKGLAKVAIQAEAA